MDSVASPQALISSCPLPDGSTLVCINREAGEGWICEPNAEKRRKYMRKLDALDTIVIHQTAVRGGFGVNSGWTAKAHAAKLDLLFVRDATTIKANPLDGAARLYRYQTQEPYHGVYSQRDRVAVNQFSARWHTYHGHASNGDSVGWAVDGLFNGKPDTDTLDVEGSTRALIHFVGCVRLELERNGLDPSQLKYIEAHRQHSDQRGRDPGPEIWSRVVLPVAKVLGLETTERTTGSGKTIPESWSGNA